jgi:hypothetical protein
MYLDTIQIHLNSADADSYNNNSKCDANFQIPNIELPSQHQILLSVQSAVIPYSFYSIDSTNNKLVYSLNHSGGTESIYIQPGNYNAIELAKYLSAYLPNFTVTYLSIQNKFIFTSQTYANFVFHPEYSTCFSLLGFTSDVPYSTGFNYSLTSYNCINLLSKQAICISSNLHTGNINHSNLSEGNILVSIPIQSNPYSLITYTNTNNLKTNLYSNSLSFINIKLYDQNNKLLNLNGCSFSVTLQIDVINFVDSTF